MLPEKLPPEAEKFISQITCYPGQKVSIFIVISLGIMAAVLLSGEVLCPISCLGVRWKPLLRAGWAARSDNGKMNCRSTLWVPPPGDGNQLSGFVTGCLNGGSRSPQNKSVFQMPRMGKHRWPEYRCLRLDGNSRGLEIERRSLWSTYDDTGGCCLPLTAACMVGRFDNDIIAELRRNSGKRIWNKPSPRSGFRPTMVLYSAFSNLKCGEIWCPSNRVRDKRHLITIADNGISIPPQTGRHFPSLFLPW